VTAGRHPPLLPNWHVEAKDRAYREQGAYGPGLAVEKNSQNFLPKKIKRLIYCFMFPLNKFPLLVGLLAWALLHPLKAQTSTWQNAAGGAFNHSPSWSDDVPGTNDWAWFSANKASPEEDASFTVTLDSNRSIKGILFDSGTKTALTLALAGYQLDLTSTDAGNPALGIGGGQALRFENGTVTAGQVRIGRALGDDSRLEIGPNTTLTLQAETRIANIAGAKGEMVLNGAGAKLTGLGSGIPLQIGFAGNGGLHLSNGANADLSGDVNVARSVGSVGLLDVSGLSTSFETTGSLRIGEAVSGTGGIGHAVFSSGAQGTAARLLMAPGSTLEINGGSLVLASPNTTKSVWRADSEYRLHLNSPDAEPLKVDALTITGVHLDLRLGPDFTGAIGDQYTLIHYTSGLTGHFVDGAGNFFDEGASISVGLYTFQLSYGGAGNPFARVELTAVPEASTSLLFLAAASAVASVAARRRRA